MQKNHLQWNRYKFQLLPEKILRLATLCCTSHQHDDKQRRKLSVIKVGREEQVFLNSSVGNFNHEQYLIMIEHQLVIKAFDNQIQTFSLIHAQMIRVISSPSRSITGLATLMRCCTVPSVEYNYQHYKLFIQNNNSTNKIFRYTHCKRQNFAPNIFRLVCQVRSHICTSQKPFLYWVLQVYGKVLPHVHTAFVLHGIMGWSARAMQ